MFTNPVIEDMMFLGLAWVAYFLVHSLLASLAVKQWVSTHYTNLMPSYRITFNFLAILLLGIPLYFTYTGNSIPLWQITGTLSWVAKGISIFAIIGFIISLRYYDMSEFIGIRQLRDKETRVEDQEHLQISPFHRYVRHPWYTFALMLIWTRPMDSLVLMSTLLMTGYFFFGSRLEESKLKQYYGTVYEDYCKYVPAIVPSPLKYLTAPKADALLQRYSNTIKPNPES